MPKLSRKYFAAGQLAIFLSVALASPETLAAHPTTNPQPVSMETRPMMEISKNNSRTINKGSTDFFTGNVQVEPLFQAQDPARVSAGKVTFEPGARSAWHTHPLGQMLIVTDGCGVVQSWGQPLQIIRAGDVIWTPPGVKHWHGASPSSKMTHIAIQESLNGKNVEWLEKVSDEEYRSNCACCEHANDDLALVAPALEKYEKETIANLWKRPHLSARDRSIVTVAALIAKNQTEDLQHQINLALDNGVKPAEISEIITHLAFYCGWPNAVSAVNTTKTIFAQRKIKTEDLPAASPKLLPVDKDAEATRAARVEEQFASVSPGVVQYTTDLLFNDLWLRPDLKPRDRSLVTVSALIACGQVLQVTYHLNRAMDNGLTHDEASEMLTQLAFYAGWPNVFSAMPVVKQVLESRAK